MIGQGGRDRESLMSFLPISTKSPRLNVNYPVGLGIFVGGNLDSPFRRSSLFHGHHRATKYHSSSVFIVTIKLFPRRVRCSFVLLMY